jgi:drug/metabolite transporter (DMT)-like permease
MKPIRFAMSSPRGSWQTSSKAEPARLVTRQGACFVQPMEALRSAFRDLSPIVQAALLMILGAISVAIQNSMIRVVSAEVHSFEVVFFRNVFGLVAMLPFMGGLRLDLFRAQRPSRLLMMSIAHVSGMICYFAAIAYLPLAEVIALAFSKPLFATVGAALVLHEVVRARRWTAVGLGIVGVLIVLRPGAQAISPFALLVLLGALLAAATTLMIKHLTRTERVPTIVWYQAMFATLFSFPLCLLHWRTPDAVGWLLLIGIGALGTLSWLTLTRSVYLADASAVVPFEFLRLPFAALLAYLWFAEVPSIWTWLGGALIFGSTIYIAQREARLARAGAAVAPVRAVIPRASP